MQRPGLVALAVVLASCGTEAMVGDAASTGVIVQVRPESAQLGTGESVVFSASVTGTALTTVTWSIQEGTSGGTVTTGGVYTAPTAQGTFHVVATSVADATLKATAQVDVAPAGPPPPAGTWQNISPPQVGAAPYGANGAAFHYGFGPIAGAVPGAPRTLYVANDNGDGSKMGVYRSTDGGASWSKCGGFSGSGGGLATNSLAVDPTNANVVYALPFKGGGGVQKSTNGCASWTDVLASGIEKDGYHLSMDPLNHLHLLYTSHSPGPGVAESTDGGATWSTHSAPVTAGCFAFFLGKNDDGSEDTQGRNWILASQANGIFRTTNGGASWGSVGSFNMTHGMESLYRASSGALFLGSVGEVYRSLDNGRSWAATGAVSSGDGYGGLVGDGTHIWTMLANTGAAAVTPPSNMRWQVLPEGDTTSAPGSSHWTFYNTQQFTDGPFNMVYDSTNRVVYASNWGGGVWKLTLP